MLKFEHVYIMIIFTPIISPGRHHLCTLQHASIHPILDLSVKSKVCLALLNMTVVTNIPQTVPCIIGSWSHNGSALYVCSSLYFYYLYLFIYLSYLTIIYSFTHVKFQFVTSICIFLVLNILLGYAVLLWQKY